VVKKKSDEKYSRIIFEGKICISSSVRHSAAFALVAGQKGKICISSSVRHSAAFALVAGQKDYLTVIHEVICVAEVCGVMALGCFADG
jgi:hypothetical protein